MDITIKTATLSEIVEKLKGMEKELSHFEKLFKVSTKDLTKDGKSIQDMVSEAEGPIVKKIGTLATIELDTYISSVHVEDSALKDFVDIVGKMIPHLLHITMSYMVAGKQLDAFGADFVKKYELNDKEEPKPTEE